MMNRKIKIILFCIAVVSASVFSSCSSYKSQYEYAVNVLSEDEMLQIEEQLIYDAYDLADIDGINSENAIVYNVTDGKIVGYKSAFERCAPASLTKLLTAIVVAENVEYLDETVTLGEKMFKYIKEQNASIAGFLPGEILTVRDLLYGMLLPSGADAAIGLAEYVSGSEEEFAKLMNLKAVEIGCFDSNFVNCTGLDMEGHYSTAYDIMLLLNYAYSNPVLKEIISSSEYHLGSTNMHSGGMVMKSTVFSKIESQGVSTEYLLCGKTGYTYDAGRCLATVNRKNDKIYIIVTLKAVDTQEKSNCQISDYDMIINNCI